MYVEEICQFPFKSRAGEKVGIEGDRIVQVRNKQGRTVTARTLGFHTTLGPRWHSLGRWQTIESFGRSSRAVQKIDGPGAQLVRDETPDRFDRLRRMARLRSLGGSRRRRT
jgi:hypothetical protein